MDDRVAQFLVSIAKLCADAHVGQLAVRLGLATGDCVAGVPEAPPEAAGGEQLDDTGYADTITVDGVAVRLSDVVEPASGARRRPERRATPPSGRPREIAAIERKAAGENAGEAEPAQ